MTAPLITALIVAIILRKFKRVVRGFKEHIMEPVFSSSEPRTQRGFASEVSGASDRTMCRLLRKASVRGSERKKWAAKTRPALPIPAKRKSHLLYSCLRGLDSMFDLGGGEFHRLQ